MTLRVLQISREREVSAAVLFPRSGYSVKCAQSLEEARRMLEQKPDLVVIESAGSADDGFCEGAHRLAAASGIPAIELPEGAGAALVENAILPILRSWSAERARSETLQAAFDRIPALLAIFGPSLEVKSVNGQFRRLLGWTEGPEDSGELLRKLFPDTGRLSGFTRLLTDAPSEWSDSPGATGGSVVETRWASARLPGGDIAAIGHDTTELKKREQQLLASEQRLNRLLEHGSEIVLIKDVHGNIRFASHSVETVLGYQPDRIVGAAMNDLVHPEDAGHLRAVLSGVIRTPGKRAAVEFRIRHANGSWRFLSANETNCLQVKGIEGIIENARDITERKEAEERLVDSQDRLRQLAARLEAIREEERTTIAREVHDELGQMLTVLKMEAEGLEARLRQSGSGDRDLLRRAHTMIGHIEVGMDSVRKISAELRPSILDHLGLAAAVQWQAEEFKNRTGVRCRVTVPEHDPPLDHPAATAVFRIFQEILTNVARHAGATLVRVRMGMTGDKLALDVRDNGRGIEPGKIGDPKSLGLLGMRERALALGGTIKFRGFKDRGTGVTLRIPLAPGGKNTTPEAGAAAREPLTAAAEVPLRILLADDHEMIRQGLKEILLREFPHASIGEAGDGQQALELMRTGEWDLMLLDISMPRKSGLEVLAELKQKESTVPVLVLSMHADLDFGRRVLEAGGAGFIHKSKAAQSLVEAIRRVLAGDRYFDDQRPPVAGIRR